MIRFLCRSIFSALLLCPMLFSQSPGDKAWSVFQAGLTDKNSDNRAIAVRLLGALTANPQAAPLAIKALSDEKPEVRSAAADAIGRLKAKSAIPQLRTTIQTENEEAGVIIAAGRALIALGDPQGYNVFYAVLTGELKSGASLMDQQKKMLKDPKKLAQFGFEQGVGFIPFGGIGLGVFKTLTKDDISPIRAAAARVLTNDPDPKTLGALKSAVSDNSWLVRAAAIDALAQRNDPNVISAITPALDDKKEAVRYEAAAAIIHLTDIQRSKTGAPAKPKATPKSKTKASAPN
jgi:HEAT repeat protein